MLLPKRVKYRRVHRGRMTGKAMRGNKVTYGDYGLQALEPSWITSNQIEAARIAMTRYIKRGGQVWISQSQKSRPAPEWVPVKVALKNGLQLLNRAELCLKSAAFQKKQPKKLCVLLCTSCLSSANS